jgi:hypothetical protein
VVLVESSSSHRLQVSGGNARGGARGPRWHPVLAMCLAGQGLPRRRYRLGLIILSKGGEGIPKSCLSRMLLAEGHAERKEERGSEDDAQATELGGGPPRREGSC